MDGLIGIGIGAGICLTAGVIFSLPIIYYRSEKEVLLAKLALVRKLQSMAINDIDWLKERCKGKHPTQCVAELEMIREHKENIKKNIEKEKYLTSKLKTWWNY